MTIICNRMEKHLIYRVSSIIILVSLFGYSLNGQTKPSEEKEKPAVALLRHRSDSATIETMLEAQLVAGSAASVTVYKTEGKVSKRIAKNDNVPTCAGALAQGEICKDVLSSSSLSSPAKLRFIYRLSAPSDAANKYLVAFSVKDAKKGEMEQLVKVAFDFEDIKPIVEAFDREQTFHTDVGFRKISFRPNGVIKIPIVFPAPNNPPNQEDEYIEERIDELYDWLEPNTVTPTGVAAVRVEPQTKDVPPQKFNVVGLKIEPNGRNTAKERRQINILLVTDKKFPANKFALEVVFASAAPPEISGRLLNTLDGIANIKSTDASKVGDDKTLGLRDFKSNLDLGLAFTSSVEEEEKDGARVRGRKNNGALDLMFAPVYNIPLDRNEVHFFTPFFIDAKISSGKITEKTLSLNRILLGTQYSIRWRPMDGNFNKYIFFFRGINASDRDFKRAEAKFNFEFRPLFDRLNNPLTVQFKTPLPDSVLIPENGKKIIPPGWFGYQIQPFAGFEVGRVYRARRDAFDNETNTRNIRRLFVGMDILLNVTRYANIKLSDTYYIRGESSGSARFRNYFNGTLEAPLLISGNTSQSVFFSFERGDQPPFATPSVNSLKIGYRITSNFFGRTP